MHATFPVCPGEARNRVHRTSADLAAVGSRGMGTPSHPIRSRWASFVAARGVRFLSTRAGGGVITQGQPKPKPDWSLADMPTQGRGIFVVTGGTGDTGYEAAEAAAAADGDRGARWPTGRASDCRHPQGDADCFPHSNRAH
jgi:hypothetical protein